MSTDRNDTIKTIKANLRRRSGKSWSVTGGRGTIWGWITIDTMPSRATWRNRLPVGALDCPENYRECNTFMRGGYMSPHERAELGTLLGLDGPCHMQGVSIPASSAYYQEYIDRSAGVTPTKIGTPYWD